MQDTVVATKPGAYIDLKRAKHNLTTAQLYEEAIRNGEGLVAASGPYVVSTGQYTGRSPKDKFVIKEPSSQDKVWWGSVNQPLDENKFNSLRDRVSEVECTLVSPPDTSSTDPWISRVAGICCREARNRADLFERSGCSGGSFGHLGV